MLKTRDNRWSNQAILQIADLPGAKSYLAGPIEVAYVVYKFLLHFRLIAMKLLFPVKTLSRLKL